MTHHTHSSMSKKGKVRWIKSIFVAILAIVIFFFSIQTCKAEGDGDLDDHISKYKDDPIAKLDELGDDFVNINFIIAEALGRIDESEKDRNINSVVVGPGSNVGDIYNIHLHEPGESITPDNSRKK